MAFDDGDRIADVRPDIDDAQWAVQIADPADAGGGHPQVGRILREVGPVDRQVVAQRYEDVDPAEAVRDRRIMEFDNRSPEKVQQFSHDRAI
ncbi:hypothetical protein [Williamsia sp. Leaf354]|uniref:hypothetical protein n=1 Tax=Williamsia sp. Leaf354 TaxID=1736349 RepID=UPI001F4622F8|nr:hypothetical protein [Williamsia sp. Leaf354]